MKELLSIKVAAIKMINKDKDKDKDQERKERHNAMKDKKDVAGKNTAVTCVSCCNCDCTVWQCLVYLYIMPTKMDALDDC